MYGQNRERDGQLVWLNQWTKKTVFGFPNLAPNSDMTLLSRSMISGPGEGTTSAVTVRVILLRVKGKSRNPTTMIGSPFAARSVTAAGGTGLRGVLRTPCLPDDTSRSFYFRAVQLSYGRMPFFFQECYVHLA